MHSLHSVKEVQHILEAIGITTASVKPGEIEITDSVSLSCYHLMKNALYENGYGLILDKKIIVIEKVKSLIIEMVYDDDFLPVKYSEYLSKKMLISYPQLSRLFKEIQKITIESYIINEKIGRVKQLLLAGEFSLSDIAGKLNYSSPAHLCGQFKKMTGLSPSGFKNK